MGKHTSRDAVYDAILSEIFHEDAERLRVQYISDASGVSGRTVRDVFKTVPYLSSKKLPTNEVVYAVEWDWFYPDS